MSLSRPVLVFVHGWGQSAQSWHGQIQYFAQDFEVQALNLPGHGGAQDLSLEQWDDALLAALPEQPVILAGWSLGSILGLRLARQYPERFAGLVLLSATPCFRMRADWPHGCADEVFNRFQESLAADAPRLLDRFFALMLQGDALDRRQYLSMVRSAVDRRQPASTAGLRSGLQLLDELDLRDGLGEITQPVLVLHGESDAVTPLAAGQYLAAMLPDATLRILPGGHALHLTQPGTFNKLLEEWCLNSISTHVR